MLTPSTWKIDFAEFAALPPAFFWLSPEGLRGPLCASFQQRPSLVQPWRLMGVVNEPVPTAICVGIHIGKLAAFGVSEVKLDVSYF